MTRSLGSCREATLLRPIFTSAHLWELVKPLVRPIQSEDAVLIFDDSIEEKLYTDESELICWHWDHCFHRNVKGNERPDGASPEVSKDRILGLRL